MGLEFLHFSERSNHAEIENRALARLERIVAPGLAPAILGDDALEIAVEIVGALERAIDIVLAQHLAADGEAAVIGTLIHVHSSGLRSRPAKAASRVSTAGLGKAAWAIAS